MVSFSTRIFAAAASAALLASTTFPAVHLASALAAETSPAAKIAVTHYRTAKVDGVTVLYRDAGPEGASIVLLLHGFPTSSHMFRNLVPLLADRYHLIAPDGQSDAPDHKVFAYTFGHYADLVDGLLGQVGARRYDMYVMDYGAPVGSS